jgi:hypothetical protein
MSKDVISYVIDRVAALSLRSMSAPTYARTDEPDF